MADILKKYGKQFKSKYNLCIEQHKVFKAITQCRTAAMGGHLMTCNQCNHRQVAFNSCRNRHCNKCQYTKQLIWVDKLKSSLPVCRYFHLVFTIPAQLHKLFYINQRACYRLLFKATAETLKKVAGNPEYLGAETGAVSVLHTWGQALTYHPHIHMLVPAGGLSPDGVEWINAGQNFFLPVKALSKVFRGIMWSAIQKAILNEQLKLPDDVCDMSILKQLLYAKNWNVYAKKPLAGPQAVVQYLGRYTHRVAISNSRLVKAEDGKVTFRWKNYRSGGKKGMLTLDAEEFIARFMMHILPCGFYKIRYYGILASANRQKRENCVVLIGRVPHISLLQGLTAKQVVKVVTGRDLEKCPACKAGTMMVRSLTDSG